MEMMMLTFESIQLQKDAMFAVIWLHGLGADGYDFMPIVPELKLDDLPIRFIFPHAPTLPVSLNLGMRMPAWFDIHEISSTAIHDEKGIETSYRAILELIEAEHAKGIAYQNIVLTGFSQGGALALYTALKFEHLLGGAMGLSTFLPLIPSIKTAIMQQRDLPVFLAHGTADPIVPIEMGQMTQELLIGEGYTVDWHTYLNMGHSVCPKEINDIRLWLRQIFQK